MKKILLIYDSLSGGTKKLAEQIEDAINSVHVVDIIPLYNEDYDIATLLARNYDLYIIGSWTANRGRTAPKVKKFIGHMVKTIGKPERVALFGTGETQFGMEFFCGGARRMHSFFKSPYSPLLIEQFPTSGDKDKIRQWVAEIECL